MYVYSCISDFLIFFSISQQLVQRLRVIVFPGYLCQSSPPLPQQRRTPHRMNGMCVNIYVHFNPTIPSSQGWTSCVLLLYVCCCTCMSCIYGLVRLASSLSFFKSKCTWIFHCTYMYISYICTYIQSRCCCSSRC